ncbi:pilin N-terminal domain-containing protein [Xylanimonas ulmi]|uniref:Gram-positive pilin subunit D1 N-terminal domain-containing protein n=1 Tax=Xylanimonas ulmi TaxID=228973 RepID=A0A4Q7M5G7_9MICO|nr:pilin N-terminal domain-containing protein [Xylanibacterium ulmi]RZS62283.1 hypothetical protein EV386_2611 [Xylanibacterium ulmi]
MIRPRMRAAIASLMAAALAVVVSLPAVAAPPALPDPGATSTLVVTKSRAGVTTAAGATFTVRQVLADDVGRAIDLATTAGWLAAEDVTVADVPRLSLGVPVVRTTGSAGAVTFAHLSTGLYFVAETGAPRGARAEGFLVALPMTDPAGAAWLHTVRAFPKNTRPASGGDSMSALPTPRPDASPAPSSTPGASGARAPSGPPVAFAAPAPPTPPDAATAAERSTSPRAPRFVPVTG